METFLGTQDYLEESEIVIIPVPYEKTTSYIKGTKNGPKEILKASLELEHFDIETKKTPKKIHTLEPINSLEELSKKVKQLKDKFIISLGGEHSITFPIVKELPKDISILQIDAHSDLRDTFKNNKFSHACVSRRIFEINKNLIQVGIRSLSKEEHDFIQENKIKVFYRDKINNEEILNSLNEKVYITIDVDSLDPSIIPSTGTPEPNGLKYKELLELLKLIFKNKNVIGLDIVELSPIKDLHAPNYTIAKLIYKLIGYKFMKS